MLTSINGTVLSYGHGYAIFDMSGFGVRVETPAGLRSPKLNAGERSLLHTAFVVREDSMTLYGFPTELELEMFHLLNTVTGVGPRSALGVLSQLEPREIADAVRGEDEKVFRKVSGIGPKTAKLILLSLSGKIPDIPANLEGVPSETNSVLDEVQEGLIMLGWKREIVETAVGKASTKAEGELSASDLMRLTLAELKNGK